MKSRLLCGALIVLVAVALGSVPAQATTIADLLAMIADLQAENAAQQAQIDALIAGQSVQNDSINALDVRVDALEALGIVDLTELENRVDTLEVDVDALQAGLVALDGATSNVQLLNPFLTVTLSQINGVRGPNAILTALNLHLVNGSGVTYDNAPPFNGLGNLIIGYNEVPGEVPLPGPVPPIIGRLGSHTLVLGMENQWDNIAGGLVGGFRNILGAPLAGAYGVLRVNTTPSTWVFTPPPPAP